MPAHQFRIVSGTCIVLATLFFRQIGFCLAVAAVSYFASKTCTRSSQNLFEPIKNNLLQTTFACVFVFVSVCVLQYAFPLDNIVSVITSVAIFPNAIDRALFPETLSAIQTQSKAALMWGGEDLLGKMAKAIVLTSVVGTIMCSILLPKIFLSLPNGEALPEKTLQFRLLFLVMLPVVFLFVSASWHWDSFLVSRNSNIPSVFAPIIGVMYWPVSIVFCASLQFLALNKK